MSDGFICVASKSQAFYKMATNLIESVKDYYPEAHCTLVTERELLDGDERVADNLILVPDGAFRDVQHRIKLWGMTQSPYDRTFYLDCDMQVEHEDICTAFDQLGDNDLMFTELNEKRDAIFKDAVFPAGRFHLCGGICLYNNANPLVKEFMVDWWELYRKQHRREWWPTKPGTDEWDTYNYPHKEFSYWDQFTLWWLTNKVDKYKELKVAIFEDDARWNYYTRFDTLPFDVTEKPPIIIHYSNVPAKFQTYVGLQ